MPASRRWTLNENLNYYVSTGIPEPRIRLELRLRRLNDAVEAVGTYDLDLVALSQRGVVTCRRTATGEVFDVKIVRDPDGSYHLAVRQTERLPLAPLQRWRG